MHARVAALTGADAVVHVHALNAVVAGRRWPGGVLLRDVETLKGIGRLAHDDEVRIPVIGNSQDMRELGDWFESGYDPRTPAVIVADHGLYAWGTDLKHARHVTECVEWLLAYALAVA
ncbi:class II aldolase/adducin family protein [Nonomuraea antimicrobica]